MTSHPLVTVAIPTYNRANSYLLQTLRGVLGQSCPDIEILVADNCSQDDTERLVGTMSDPRIRYFRHPQNIGANNNFNFCVQEARGEYFLLLHDDDAIDKDFVEVCLKAVDHNPCAGLIRTGTRIIDADSKILRECPNLVRGLSIDGFFRGWFSGATALYLCSTLFNTGKLREMGGFNSKHNCYQDVMVQLPLAAKYGRVDITEVKASFRIHEGEGGFGRQIVEWCEDSVALLDLMCDLVPVNKTQVRKEGVKFFSRANYYRASTIKAPRERIIAYAKVMKHFNYRHLPPVHHVPYLFQGTYAYAALRSMKHAMKLLSSRYLTIPNR